VERLRGIWHAGLRRESFCRVDCVQPVCRLHCGITRFGHKQQKLRHQSDLSSGATGSDNSRVSRLPSSHKRIDFGCLRIAGLSCHSSHADLATVRLDASAAGLPGDQLGTVFPRGLCAGSGAVNADANKYDDVSERRILPDYLIASRCAADNALESAGIGD